MLHLGHTVLETSRTTTMSTDSSIRESFFMKELLGISLRLNTLISDVARCIAGALPGTDVADSGRQLYDFLGFARAGYAYYEACLLEETFSGSVKEMYALLGVQFRNLIAFLRSQYLDFERRVLVQPILYDGTRDFRHDGGRWQWRGGD